MQRIRKGSGCPVCGQPVAQAFRPFCSSRCKDRDLIAWIDGGYRMPGPLLGEDDLDSLPGREDGSDPV